MPSTVDPLEPARAAPSVTATLRPNPSFSAPSAPNSFASSTQASPSRTNRYPAPWTEFSPTAAKSAPSTTRSPPGLMATPTPTLSYVTESEVTSFASSTQASPSRTNTYAAPVLGSTPAAPIAPITAVSSVIATENPNRSSGAPSEAARTVGSPQPWLRENTYTAPRRFAPSTCANGAPTNTVSPATATPCPNWSPRCPSGASSRASCCQRSPVRVNT